MQIDLTEPRIHPQLNSNYPSAHYSSSPRNPFFPTRPPPIPNSTVIIMDYMVEQRNMLARNNIFGKGDYDYLKIIFKNRIVIYRII